MRMSSKRQNIRKGIVISSFLFFPITIFYLSPYLAIESSGLGVVAGCLILFFFQFITSLFFGRAFCAWVCPVAGLNECLSTVTKRKAKYDKTRFIKYIIWIPWVISIVLLFISAGGIKVIDPLFMTHGGLPMLGIAGHVIYYGVVILIVILTLIGGKRWFCHALCWMAPFMVIGSKLKDFFKFPSLKIYADPSKCIDCDLCNKKCSMGLDVKNLMKEEKIKNSECILCGECVDACRVKVFSYKKSV